ncbi:hypothetical protein LZK73_18670 [Neorhizobium galegae]|nr:hypothetical protein LZK73_18670 [Neorhizobium galegae]
MTATVFSHSRSASKRVAADETAGGESLFSSAAADDAVAGSSAVSGEEGTSPEWG